MNDTETRTKNVALARRVRQVTREHPSALYMGGWMDIGMDDARPGRVRTGEDILADDTCGTTACFAGWTALLSGYALDDDGFAYRDSKPVMSGGYHLHGATVAADLLGLDYKEANDLFYTHDDELDDALCEIFGEKI